VGPDDVKDMMPSSLRDKRAEKKPLTTQTYINLSLQIKVKRAFGASGPTHRTHGVTSEILNIYFTKYVQQLRTIISGKYRYKLGAFKKLIRRTTCFKVQNHSPIINLNSDGKEISAFMEPEKSLRFSKCLEIDPTSS